MTASYSRVMGAASKRATYSRAACARARKRCGSRMEASMAAARDVASPTAVNSPQRPPSRISPGPCGQSVEITGVPQAIASVMTLPNPSQREESTKLVARDMKAKGFFPKLERQIAALKLSSRIRLPGYVKNPFAFMARATSFVLSSRWEGFGNVITEAMACGTPVISTDCPHGPGEILEGGRWGELTPVGDATSLAAAMLASIREPQRFRARAHAAREYVARFEAARITREYEAVIRQVCLGQLEIAA